MKEAPFDGPYGLTEIERWLDSDACYAPLYAALSDTRTPERYILHVKTAEGNVMLDAYKDGTENMQEAVQWLADIAGAMTGMEVEVSIYKE